MTPSPIVAAITGTGLWNAPDVITNDELVASFNEYVRRQNERNAAAIARGEALALEPSSVEFIEKASGIRQRYVLDRRGVLDPERMRPYFAPRPNEQLSLQVEIALGAARDALAMARREAADIDLVIIACANMQRAYPAMAIELQQALGASGYAYDMNVACSSATFGIEQAANAIRAGTSRAALVVSPEITSAHLDWRDRDSHFIFGDVCTAVVLEDAAKANVSARFDILGTKLATRFSNNIRNNAGFLGRCEDVDRNAHDQLFVQEGRKVFKEVCPMVVEHISGHLAQLGIDPQSVARYWLHQANLNMNLFITRKLLGADPGPERAPVILDEYANTASAGSIIAFHRHDEDLAAGDIGVICSFGAGYSIGCVVVRRVQ